MIDVQLFAIWKTKKPRVIFPFTLFAIFLASYCVSSFGITIHCCQKRNTCPNLNSFAFFATWFLVDQPWICVGIVERREDKMCLIGLAVQGIHKKREPFSFRRFIGHWTYLHILVKKNRSKSDKRCFRRNPEKWLDISLFLVFRVSIKTKIF